MPRFFRRAEPPGIEIRRGSCVRPVVLLRQREAARPRGLVASRKSQLKEAEGFELVGSLERASVDRCQGSARMTMSPVIGSPMVPCTAAGIAADAMRFTNPTVTTEARGIRPPKCDNGATRMPIAASDHHRGATL